jgi:hypothetical protein
MKRLLMLTVIAGLLILSGCATMQTEGPQPPAAGKMYVMPAKITILDEVARPPKDTDEAQLLEEKAKKNDCVKMINTPGGDKIFLVFCGNPQEPYCVPRGAGKPPLCY